MSGRGRPGPFALLALVLLALGAGLFAVAGSLDDDAVGLVAPNAPIAATATDLRVIDANNSPTVVRNPTDPSHLVVVNRVDTPRFSCAMHLSLDAGATWEPVEIPFPAGEEQPPAASPPTPPSAPPARSTCRS